CEKITLKDGKEIICTPEHPLLIINKKGELIWKCAGEISIGDFITTSEQVPS
ncbi:unnamed protein product, partial [marine sediment metagenome]